MSARLIRTVVLGAFAILLMSPSRIAAQTADAQDNPVAAQTPATHEHEHGSPTAAVKTEASQSCCAKAASDTSHDAGLSAPPAADQRSDTANTPGKGCCGGMMSNMKSGMMNDMKKDDPTAEHSPTTETHSCCCGGMKM